MKSNIKYIREDIPSFEIPPYKGDRYEALVPDTFDIAERARLAVNGLTAPTNPEADHEIYFHVDVFHNPPLMINNIHDWCITKFAENLPSMRMISGSDLNSHVDETWMRVLLHSIGPDGLVYNPIEGRPWAWSWADPRMGPIWTAEGKQIPFADKSVKQYATSMNLQGRWCNTMSTYFQRDGNPMWKETMEKLVGRLEELSVNDDEFYFPAGLFLLNAKVPREKNYRTFIEKHEMIGWSTSHIDRLPEGIVSYYKLTGSESALKLAGNIANMMMNYRGPEGVFFDDDGTFLSGHKFVIGQREELQPGHFHAHTAVVVGILEYALATGDDKILDFIRKVFEFGKSYASPVLGWVPKSISRTYGTDIHPVGTILQRTESEGCAVADMVELALKLSEAGVADYWDDADRWIRNYFAECQLTRTSWIESLVRPQSKRDVLPNETAERVAERNIGGFAGYPGVNEWALHTGIQQCCTGNGVRAIHYIWKHILNHEGKDGDGKLKVNLLLNRASKWADVASHIPYTGQVDIKMKQRCGEVQVRAPEWIEKDSRELSCTVGDEKRSVRWDGRYVQLGSAKEGETVTLRFPISERSERTLAGGMEYTIDVKGNTVVYISPAGVKGPLYQRDHYRENETRWVKRERFVSDDTVQW